jgi:hypothetical protein
MSFIVAAPTPETEEEPITNGEFWPEVDPAIVRAEHRIDNTVTTVRLRHHLVEAIITTNRALKAWRLEREAEGIDKLEDVDAEEIDGTTELVIRYHRAVGCLTKALLLERFRDFDSTAAGDKKADALTDPIDDLRRDHLNAIADIVGRTRSTIELI